MTSICNKTLRMPVTVTVLDKEKLKIYSKPINCIFISWIKLPRNYSSHISLNIMLVYYCVLSKKKCFFANVENICVARNRKKNTVSFPLSQFPCFLHNLTQFLFKDSLLFSFSLSICSAFIYFFYPERGKKYGP